MAKQVVGFEIVIDGLGRTIETATELKRAIAFVNEEIKKTSDVQELKKLEAKLIDLKAAQMEVNKVVREQIKTRNEEITATDKANGAYRKLSKELNDQRNRYKDLAAAEQDTSQEARDLLVSITALDKKLKGIDASVGQFQRNVGGYTEALSNFFPKLGGTLGQVTGAIGGVSNGITALGKTTGAVNLSLGAIGIALTAFSAISEIFSSINQTVEETRRLSAQVSNFTGETGSTLQSFVAQSRAIAVTYNKDVNEIVVAANTASKELGVSFPEALSAIELGFRKGADAQGEFLDSLREYPSQLGQAGFSLSEFTAIAIDSANQGIYSDKAIDAIKEFGTQTREQTKSVKDAFNDALGSDFTEKLFSDLNTNAISGRDALALVTKEIQTTGVSGKELQGLISTVFVGAGEDAGRYVLSLGDVLNKTNEILGSTNEYQNQQKALYESNLDLQESQADLNELLGDTASEFTLLNNRAKTFFNNFLVNLLDIANKFPATLKAISTGFTTFFAAGFNLKAALKANSDVYRNELNKINKEDKIAADKRAADELIFRTKTEAGIEKTLAEKRALRKTLIFGTPDYIKADAEIKVLEKKLKEFKPIINKDEVGNSGKEIAKAFVDGSLAKLQEEQSKLQKAFGEAVVGSDAQKEIGVKLTAVNEEIKKSIEIQNEILGLNAEKKKEDAINEINQNFDIAKTIIELDRVKKEVIENEIENLNEKRFILKDDYNAELQRIDALIALEKQGSDEIIKLQNQRLTAETNFIKSKQSLDKEEKAINDKRIEAQKKYSQIIKELEIDSIENETERQIASAKNKLAIDLENLEKDKDFILISELEKARLRALLVDKSEKEIKAIRDGYKKKEDEDDEERRRKLREAIINGIAEVVNFIGTLQQNANQKAAEAINQQIERTENNIQELEARAEKASGLRKKRIERDIATQKELLKTQQAEAEALRIQNAKEEKRIALIQAIIQGALGVQRALASSSPPINFINAAAVGIATAAQIATISAQPLAEGGVVTGQRINQKQNIPTRSNGDNVLAFVKRGEVVLNQRQQALLGGSPTFRKIGIKGFADGGLVPPISAPATITNATKGVDNLIAVLDAKTDAINSRIDRLQAYVVSDDIARDLAEGNKLKVNATL